METHENKRAEKIKTSETELDRERDRLIVVGVTQNNF